MGRGRDHGQTFTTGDKPVQLSAITFRICETCTAAPTKHYGIRLGSVVDKSFTLLHQETAEQTEPFVTGGYVTWRLDKPIPLNPGTKYGVDVDMLSSTSEWKSGIPYLQRFPVDKNPGGEVYSPGGEGNATLRLVGGDRVFHLDLEASDGSSAPPPVVVTPAGESPAKPAPAGPSAWPSRATAWPPTRPWRPRCNPCWVPGTRCVVLRWKAPPCSPPAIARGPNNPPPAS